MVENGYQGRSVQRAAISIAKSRARIAQPLRLIDGRSFSGKSHQPNQRTKTEVEISRKLVVKCAKIRDLEEDALLQLVAKLLMPRSRE